MVSTDQIAARGIFPPERIPRLRIWLTRGAILVTIAALWEILAHSRVLFEDVVPPLCVILPAMLALLTSADFYRNLGVSAAEIAAGTCVGGAAGLAVGVAIGTSRFRIRAFEPHLRYLAPTPKIIFFPVMIMWFGIGFGSKIAMGACAAFFPVALSVVAGMRGIDEVLINVGKSFGATRIQMIEKIYIPAMIVPILNGIRLGFGVCVIGVLLAETKLSNQGVGFLISESYRCFNMPEMYALLILIFILAATANSLLEMAARRVHSGR